MTRPSPDGALYGNEFFDFHEKLSRESARAVVPWLLEHLDCHSVVDVGCGRGIWAATFIEQGVADVRGIDGDYVDRSRLAIPPEYFSTCDLRSPRDIGRRFDLAICLEVAEHLPAESADPLIDFLCALSDRCVISAAVPGQPGVGHINAQWPEYWASRFRARNYHVIDCLRARFWTDDRVAFWYRQNMFLAVAKSTEIAGRITDTPTPLATASQVHALVHPRMAALLHDRCENPSLRQLLGKLPAAAHRAVKRLLRGVGDSASGETSSVKP